MNNSQQQRFNFLYEQHLTNLRLQGKRPATIDGYSRAVRRISAYFAQSPDCLTTANLKDYFNSLIQTHSWSTVKIERNGLQFFYRYTLILQKVWRARMLDAIVQYEDLSLPKTGKLPPKWVVDCRKVGYGLPALQYLSHYLYRGVLPDKDILDTANNTVTFRYKDGQTQATKTRTLPALNFLWLILQHVLPKGLQRVRDYGFLHGNAKRMRLRIQAILLHLFNWQMPLLSETNQSKAIRICPCCHHEMKCVGITRTT